MSSKDQTLCRQNMLLESTSRAYECPQKYIQGPDEFRNVFAYGSKYGNRFLFIIDGGIYEMIVSMIEEIEDHSGCSFEIVRFAGECCMENVEQLADTVRQHNCNVLVGIGGGKILDVTKLVSDEVNEARIIVPTSASSDAPAADWAAVYTPEGIHISGRPTRRSTELVLVDSKIIVGAPARLFAAGIGDALATWFEAVACEKAYTPNCVGFRPTRAAMALCKECHEILMEDGVAALRAVKSHVVTEAVENVIEANILLSGLGFINGGLAGSHGFHNGFSTIFSSRKYLHGEIIAFGLVCQLILENAPKEQLEEIMEFLFMTDLPLSLESIGIERTPENLESIVDHMFNHNALIHHEPMALNKEALKHVICAADDAGKAFLMKKA